MDIGRRSVLFAQNGYEVKAVDLSEYAVNNLNNWGEREQLSIKTYFSEFEFVIPTLEQTEYNVENSAYYSKHFNLFLRKK